MHPVRRKDRQEGDLERKERNKRGGKERKKIKALPFSSATRNGFIAKCFTKVVSVPPLELLLESNPKVLLQKGPLV